MADTLWRGVAGLIVFIIGYLVLALLLEFIFGFANLVSQNWSLNTAQIIGALLGGVVGVGGGVIGLDAVLSRYPAKGIAVAFIMINMLIVVGDFVIVPNALGQHVVIVQAVRALTASASAFYVLWLGRKFWE
jgi:hypothetical protein